MKKFTTILIAIFTLFTVQATDYYINKSTGNDGNTGTSTGSPWQTISKVNGSSFSPGDNILFNRGDVWREQLIPPSNGSSGNPITFGAYGSGNRPIINAADIITGWASIGSNQWQHSQPTVVPLAPYAIMVIINGVIQYPDGSASSGNYNFNTTTHILTIYSTTDPNTITVEVTQRSYCILIGDGGTLHHDILFTNLDCRYSGRGGLMMMATGSHYAGNVEVNDCYFYANRLHSCVAYDRFDNTNFHDSRAEYNGNGFYAWISTDQTIRNCSTLHNIEYKNQTDGHGYGNYQGDGWLVENNFSDDDADALHIDAGGVAANAIIRYNKIFNSKSGSPNTPGIGVGSLAAGAVISIYYNLIVNCASAGFESYSHHDGTINFWNNTVVLNTTSGQDAAAFIAYPDNFNLKNNIFKRDYVAGEYMYYMTTGTPSSDYNLFYNGGQQPRFYWAPNSYTTFATWQLSAGQDAHGQLADPLLNGDYSLQSTSPAINAGVDLGLSHDINGTAITGLPDQGAFEYPGAPVPLTIDSIRNRQRLSLGLYPNPVGDFVTIRFKSQKKESVQIRISNTSGAVVWLGLWKLEHGTNTIDIPVKNLLPGLYYFKINDFIEPFLKQ